MPITNVYTEVVAAMHSTERANQNIVAKKKDKILIVKFPY